MVCGNLLSSSNLPKMVQDFKKLNVWKEAHNLSLDMYKIICELPKEEKFALGQQFRRAVTSIEMNIAEGCGRKTNLDFKKFLYHAMGSIKEVENILLLIKDLNLISTSKYENYNQRTNQLGAMLNRLIQTIPDI